MTFHVPEKYRITTGGGALNSDASFGNNGAFIITSGQGIMKLRVIASDGEGWEHVSVSTYRRCPTWTEMCLVRNLFWDEEDCTVQFYPPKSEYVNFHPYTLHWWRPAGSDLPRPPPSLVGPRI